MGKLYDSIDKNIRNWIDRQKVFFVATAPLSANGFVNLSPKGFDTLRILDDHTLAYLDVGGSGIETTAHLKENGRIVIMMCAFDGPPKIYRFHGQGVVITAKDPGFSQLAARFDRSRFGIRGIVRVDVTRISDSCGFGVPFCDFRAQRESMDNYLRDKTADDMRAYFRERNSESIDGLPGISDEEADAYQPRERD